MLFNVELVAFMEPKQIKIFYTLITDEYEDEYEAFFKYFQKQWINKKKLEKYIPYWNYYINFNNIDFG